MVELSDPLLLSLAGRWQDEARRHPVAAGHHAQAARAQGAVPRQGIECRRLELGAQRAFQRALSGTTVSAGEPVHPLHTREVAVSKPAVPIARARNQLAVTSF